MERWLSLYSPRKSTDAQAATAGRDLYERVSQAALDQTKVQVTYDPGYVRIAYPGGDVPANSGVCTDVVIRAYRKVGIDLQVDVHEDMKADFSAYPRIWHRREPDTNIDHRRVPNLMTFFSRHGSKLPIDRNPDNFKPGDIVAWDLGGGITHIGLVVDRRSVDGARFQIVHNIGAGPKLEDVLFSWRMLGHFRYEGWKR